MRKVLKLRHLKTCFVFLSIILLLYYPNQVTDEKFVSEDKNIEIVEKNYSHFESIVKYLNLEKQCSFIYRSIGNIRYLDEDNNTLILPENIKKNLILYYMV